MDLVVSIGSVGEVALGGVRELQLRAKERGKRKRGRN